MARPPSAVNHASARSAPACLRREKGQGYRRHAAFIAWDLRQHLRVEHSLLSRRPHISRRLLRRRQHNSSFAGKNAKNKRLLQIQPHGRFSMTEVADRNILTDIQLKIA